MKREELKTLVNMLEIAQHNANSARRNAMDAQAIARRAAEDADSASGEVKVVLNWIRTQLSDPCPVCGEEVTITGKTTDGRLIGSCGDAFDKEAWEAEE